MVGKKVKAPMGDTKLELLGEVTKVAKWIDGEWSKNINELINSMNWVVTHRGKCRAAESAIWDEVDWFDKYVLRVNAHSCHDE